MQCREERLPEKYRRKNMKLKGKVCEVRDRREKIRETRKQFYKEVNNVHRIREQVSRGRSVYKLRGVGGQCCS